MKKQQPRAKPKSSKGFLKRAFNFRAWVGYDMFRDNTKLVKDWIRQLFVPNMGEVSESLDNAQARLGISDQELLKKKKALHRLAWFLVFLSLLIFGYAYYNIIHEHYRAVVVSIAVALVSLSFAFRYHFWYFQIKQRKLGCTLKEWFTQGLLGMK